MSCGLQGTSEVVREPKIVDLPERITKIKAGASHTCAIGQSGTLYCWGIIARLLPELKKDAEGRPLPVGIFRPEAPIVEISSLGVYACVLLENSSVYCWGMNTDGQLSPRFGRADPLKEKETSRFENRSEFYQFEKVALHLEAGGRVSCVVFADTSLDCWGRTLLPGKRGADVLRRTIQSEVPGAQLRDVRVGGDHICFVTSENQLFCWGDNSYRQALPYSLESYLEEPKKVLSGVGTVYLGAKQTCALTLEQRLICWGEIDCPVAMQGQEAHRGESAANEWMECFRGIKVETAAIGPNMLCALSSEGNVYCSALSGPLNVIEPQQEDARTGRTEATKNAQRIPLPGPMQSVAAGMGHACALSKSGKVYCWGQNQAKQAIPQSW
tara:strand:+ start:3585 stop:4736 length:1152 start_codon:yes stop_codon:yes gene_type:complete